MCHVLAQLFLSTADRAKYVAHVHLHSTAYIKKLTEPLLWLQVQSEKVCQASVDEEDLHWKVDQEAKERERLARCTEIKHTFVRTARECSNVDFIMHSVRTRDADLIPKHISANGMWYCIRKAHV